jgi:hypothetical protein
METHLLQQNSPPLVSSLELVVLKAILFAAVVILGISPFSVAQYLPKESACSPADLSASPLVAWSDLQKPRPIPEITTPPDRQLQDRLLVPHTETYPAAASTLNFTGTIVNDDGRHFCVAPARCVQSGRSGEGREVPRTACQDFRPC